MRTDRCQEENNPEKAGRQTLPGGMGVPKFGNGKFPPYRGREKVRIKVDFLCIFY
jgi:hypothetical protein